MIEPAPKTKDLNKAFQLLLNPVCKQAIEKTEKDYLCWDKAKHLAPEGIKPEEFWSAVKLSRTLQMSKLSFPCCSFFYNITPSIQKALHEFDIDFAELPTSVPNKDRKQYLASSIMEEAIASSQMEGAATTRIVAKKMLMEKSKPTDISQQMILNNYKTILFLSEKKDSPLSADFLLEVHRNITEKTLEKPECEGAFRTDDSIVVQNGITGEVVHNPPTHTQIKPSIASLCSFINDDKDYIHPLVKAIILHFMISYLHPFVDGNGRTARSLFYWYLLKKGYRLAEYLAVSRIIYRSKAQYEKSFLQTENDEMDATYFIVYNLGVVEKAYKELQAYIERKTKKENALLEIRIPGINERQARILKNVSESPKSLLTCKNLENTLLVSSKTIRSDLEGLVNLGLLEKVPLNQRLCGYARSAAFQEKIQELVCTT